MKFSRKIIALSVVFSLTVFTISSAYAEKAKKDVTSEIHSEVRIGTINATEHENFNKLYKSIQGRYQDTEEKSMKSMSEMRTTHDKKITDIEKKKGILDPEKYDKAVNSENERFEKQKSDLLQKSQSQIEKITSEVQNIMSIVRGSMQDVAKEEKIDLMIEETAIMFKNDDNPSMKTVDLTNKIAERFMSNKDIKSFIKANSK
ncbi:hypothetical protein GUI12_02450 [Anaplasmataceae bacterium AB001_6]|nr:hypothetical protein GUI12_02450 [Anaplasmataceae bacterium AB001_6]